jgi:metal-sulfur cluster biosynthetic enzyme
MAELIARKLQLGCDDPAVLDRLARVLDPELDESILELGFVQSLELGGGRAHVELRLPTNWCAVNFAYLMAEDVRRALLGLDGVVEVSVGLGEHCAAPEIEAAVNSGRPFAAAFAGEGAGSLAALRLTFSRKGFFSRQERLLRALREAGLSPAAICALRLAEVSIEGDTIAIRRSDAALHVEAGALLLRYLERRAELGLDCSPEAALIIGLDGRPFSAEELQRHYEAARTMRVALEANGSFCRAMIARGSAGAGEPSRRTDAGGENAEA